jgi:pyroglutamyl-peptidase
VARRDRPARPAAPRAESPLRVLLTGFAPFGGESINPSRELVLALAGAAAPHPRLQLFAEVLPVDRARLAGALHEAIERHRPDVVLSVGQATGRAAVDLEGTARNVIDFKDQRDNGGNEAHGEAWLAGAPPQRRVRLPLGALARTLAGLGLPVAVSRDAGRHLCNATLYLLLHRHAGLPAFFVHVPLLPEQAGRRGKGEPSLPIEVSRRCLEELLALLPDLLAAAPPEARKSAPLPEPEAEPER